MTRLPPRITGVAPGTLVHATRKLHLGHFAFMRAYVEGLDVERSWDRYLAVEGNRSDARVVRRTVAWLRHEFAAAAKLHRRPGSGRLVQLDVDRLVPVRPGPAPPSLEEFALARGLEDFSVEDQQAAYDDEYGTAPVDGRRARLLRKQLDALRWLEQRAAENPRADDLVEDWLNPELAVRLVGAGIQTLRQLAERVNGMAASWYSAIPAIGQGKAGRIVDWLRLHESTTGLRIANYAARPLAVVPRAQLVESVPATDLVPVERLVVPSHLDGSFGTNRAPRNECLLTADTDLEAALAFIRAKNGLADEVIAARRAERRRRFGADAPLAGHRLEWLLDLSHTQRAYLTEIERFILWSIVERRKALSSMTFEDCADYKAFLANPIPLERWCAPRSRTRFGAAWRPFEGPLQANGRRRAVSVLTGFFSFLVSQRYLRGNPWDGVGKPKPPARTLDRSRSLTLQQWMGINRALEDLPPTSANLRLRFGMRLLYNCALRRSEAVQARCRDLKWRVYAGFDGDPDDESGWVLTVIGKGDKEREVPVPQQLVDELCTYLASRGLEPDPGADSNTDAYLLGVATDIAERASWAPAARIAPDRLAGIGAQTFYDQIKAFFASYVDTLAKTDGKSAERLRRASTHWLRHTSITHAIAAGTPLDVTQGVAGHASLSTTSLYLDAEGRRRVKETKRFFASPGAQRPDRS